MSVSFAFIENLREFLDQGGVIRQGIWAEGPGLIDYLVEHYGSLRKAAKATGMSPTYLSQVRSSKTIMAPERFMDLYEKAKRT